MPQLYSNFEENDVGNKIHNIFYDEDIEKIDKIKIPELLRFYRADKFDDKFMTTHDQTWVFYYSGRKVSINFSGLNYFEEKLAKFFLFSYVQINTPSSLDKKYNAFFLLINILKKRRLKLDFIHLKEILRDLGEKNHTNYYAIKFIIRLLFLEEFSGFDIEKEYELELLPRPKYNSAAFYYQEKEDLIDHATITMIQQGFIRINHQLKSKVSSINNRVLINSSILGLLYVSGLRPVQMAKLAAGDIKEDTTREMDGFCRHSILIPYAKQARFQHEKIAIKLPEEVAEIILAYIERFELLPHDKLFEMGDSSVRYCFHAINEQLFQFSSKNYQEAVLNGELLQQKYSSSDFRHHVGYSLAMAGATAEEIAYVLGHSSLVTARHYIFSTPELAQIRALALGKNPLYKQMIAMLLTGRLVHKDNWKNKKVLGNIGHNIHFDIGGCAYEDKCLFHPVRNCYGCMYFHPFIDADHENVLTSIQNEINTLIKLSDGIGISRNPLILIHESTKFEIESVINRCKIYKDGIYES